MPAKAVLVGNLICRLHQGLTVSQAWSIECILHKNGQTKQRSFNDTMVFIKSISYNIWTDPGSKNGSTKLLVCNNWI